MILSGWNRTKSGYGHQAERPHNVSGLTAGELEQARRELAASVETHCIRINDAHEHGRHKDDADHDLLAHARSHGLVQRRPGTGNSGARSMPMTRLCY